MIELSPGRAAFAERYEAGEAQLVSTRLPDDVETPVSAMLKLGRDRPNAFLLESVEGGNWRGRFSAIGLDPDLIWRVRDGVAEAAEGDDLAARRFRALKGGPLEELRALIKASAVELGPDTPPIAAGLFGYLGFDMVRFVEKVPIPEADPIGAPEALLLRPTIVIVFDALQQEMTIYTPARPERGLDAEAAYEAARERIIRVVEALQKGDRATKPAGGAGAAVRPASALHEETYRAMVATAKSHIRAGDVFQVVPAQRFSAPFPLPPFALYRALRRLNPSPFLFYLNFDDMAVVGSSPEILVRVREGRVTVRPIAGTRPRGANEEEDTALEAELLADPKERAEHLMLLDLGRNDVGRVADAGTVRVTEQFAVERYSHVMHIVSNVEGRLKKSCDAVDALFAGFPAGTVSGAPKVRALEIIAALEPEKRGVYAGGVGYFSAGGDMDTCIALRTAVVKDGVLNVTAGAGVVFDSDPETERLETIHKAGALFRAAAEASRFV